MEGSDSKSLDLLSNILVVNIRDGSFTVKIFLHKAYLMAPDLCSQHSSVGRSLITISLHLHATSHPNILVVICRWLHSNCTHFDNFQVKGQCSPADGLPAGEVGDVNEGVVEGGKDVSNAEDKLTIPDLRSQANLDLLLSFSLSLPGCHDLARPLQYRDS